MSFLNNIIKEFTHKDQNPNQGYGGQSYGQPSYNSNNINDRPQVFPPWIAEWDTRDNRWLFTNRETGQRTFDYRPQSYGGPQSGAYNQGQYYEQESPQKSHTGRNVALGAAAGLAGGALLTHEGEKVEEQWNEDKYRLESDVSNADNYVDNKVYDGVQDVEDFPDDAASWTGRKVQEVEDIPQDIENKWENGVQDVEDIPDDVAGWAGRKFGDVERFGDDVDRCEDGIEDSYDQGRNEGRYDDDDGRY